MSTSMLGTLVVMVGAGAMLGQPGSVLVKPAVEGTVLVLPIGSSQEMAGEAARVTTALVNALSRHSALSVLTPADISDLVAFSKAKDSAGCETDDECRRLLAEAADAQFTVSGYLGAIGKSYVLSLVLIDAEQLYPVARIDRSTDAVDELLSMMPRASSDLLGSTTATTTDTTFALPSGHGLSFAVLELEAAGIADTMAQTLTQVLSVQIKSVEGATVISRSDLEAMIGAEKLHQLSGSDCDGDCMAEIGGAMGVDRLVVGSVGLLADTHAVTLRLIDPRQVLVENRVTETFRGDPGELIRAVRHAGRRLLGLETSVGTLAISADQEGCLVSVDHIPIGTLPLAPVVGVRSGRHIVRVDADGYYPRQTEVYVDPGQTTAVFAQLQELPTQWYEEWWVWSVAGAVAAGAGVAIALIARDAPTTGTVVVDVLP